MAAKIQILSNTNYPLADVIKNELMDCSHVRIAVAFLKKSGIEQIAAQLDYALNTKGTNIEIIVGLDFKTTDAAALYLLKELESSNHNFNFYCFGDKKGNYNELVFHPKIYLFDKSSLERSGYTSIVGSSNMTAGGLTSNFEVNSIFKEDTPKYFSQLSAIYEEIKYTDSVFCPSKQYILKYSNVKMQLDESKNNIDEDTLNAIDELRLEEYVLPGTIPSLKRVIIEYLLDCERQRIIDVSLGDIYSAVSNKVVEKRMNIKMDTIENSIRGELNKHEADSNHKDGLSLFKRMGRGIYSLTEKGRNYAER